MRVIGVLLLPGTRVFDFGLISEVFRFDRPGYTGPDFEIRLCATTPDPVALHPAATVTPTHALSALPGCDLVIAPGRADHEAPVPPAAITALRAAHRQGVPLAALCSGAFTLAAAGLLDDRPATTHWSLLTALAGRAPTADVHSDALYTRSTGDTGGAVFTSAGVVSGLDLCLHLLRRAHGAELATEVARRLVMPPVRAGGQRQYVSAPMPVRPDRPAIAATVDWALSRLGEPIGVPELAARAGRSPRTFHREFAAATGTTPGRWLLAQRIRHAQRLLESTDLPVRRVAERSGLGTPANLRRRLRAELGVTPDDYRRTFRVPGPAAVAGDTVGG